MSIQVTFLGTGPSLGIPIINCNCPVCTSSDLKDKRLRSSIAIKNKSTTVIVDSGPDFRQQMLRSSLSTIDAVLFTHSHRDHSGGFAELLSFPAENKIILAGTPDLISLLQSHIQISLSYSTANGPEFEFLEVDKRPFSIGNLKFKAIHGFHGQLPVIGFLCGKFAYLTDINHLTNESKALLNNLDVIVLSALQQKQHKAHLSVEEAIEWLEDFKPKTGYLTHLSHEAGFHKDLEKQLPDFIKPAYDGLVIQIS